MLDISWTEFLLIGIVALIVIGPKELPTVMRAVGQWTRKVRGIAADFQGQFQEALREAEMGDLKKEVDDLAAGIKNYDPLKDVRRDVEAAGQEIQASLQAPPVAAATAETAADAAAATDAAAETPGPVTEFPAAAAATELKEENIVGEATAPVVLESAENAEAERSGADTSEVGDKDVVAAGIGPVMPETLEKAPQPERTGRS